VIAVDVILSSCTAAAKVNDTCRDIDGVGTAVEWLWDWLWGNRHEKWQKSGRKVARKWQESGKKVPEKCQKMPRKFPESMDAFSF